jgi:hypothetical protein
MKRECFLILISVFFVLTHFAIQAQTMEGTEFWLTFGKNSWWHDNNSDLNLQIRIASNNQQTAGTIYFTDIGVTVPFNIGTLQVFTHNLNELQKQAAYNTSQGISNKSIYITTDQPVTVYALNQTHMSTDATNILPVTALGTNYYQISYTPYQVSNPPLPTAYDAYAVVGIKNNTNLYHNGIFEATIDSGQIYYRTSSTDMTGAHITTDNPVAFFAVNQRVLIPASWYNFDCLMQQLAPVDIWGNDFFVPASHRGKDRVRIVASQNNTQITITGGTVISGNPNNLQASQFVEVEVYLSSNGCYIQANKPIGVCTYLTGWGYNFEGLIVNSDPAQCWLPSLDKTVTEALMTPLIPTGETTIEGYHALVITPTNNKNETTVSIDGAPATALSGGNWMDHFAAGMSFYNMPLSNLNVSYLFTNSNKLIVLCYATGEMESYYHLANAAIRNVYPVFYVNDISYKHLQLHTFCGNVAFRAHVVGMSEEPGSLKWYIDDIEQTEIQDSLTWSKYFPAKEYNVKMMVRFSEENSVTLESTLHVVAEISATASPFGGGEIEGVGCYSIDDEVVLTAKPNVGYNFVKWTDEAGDVSIEETLIFTVTGTRNLVAHFELKTYDVLLSANPSQYGTVSDNGYNIPHGTSVTVNAIPSDSCNFLNWTENGTIVSSNAIYTFNIVANRTLVANFALNTYNIDVSAYPTQGGNATGGGNNVLHGSTVTLSATPNTHFDFVNWTEDGMQVSTDLSFKFTATKSRTLVANFQLKSYSVNIEVNENDYGYATGAGGYEALYIAQIRAFANNCYRFANWTINGVKVSTNNPYTFTVTENVNLVANFYALDFDTYVAMICDNIFLLNLKKLSEDGYDVSNCKWFKNGMEEKETRTINEFSYSAGANELLELAPTYYMFQLITSNYGNLCSSKKIITSKDKSLSCPGTGSTDNLFVYPNPVLCGGSLTIEGVIKDSPIYVYNHLGACVFNTFATDEITTLTFNLPQGIYLIRANEKVVKIMIMKL